MLSIGQQLSRARTDRDLTIEDVAFHTHVPVGRIRDMENDDLSRFANLTYARGFLKIYSQYLELDISEYLDQFSTADFANASGHEYVQMANATQNLPAAVFTDHGEARRSGLYILLFLVAAGGGIVWWFNRPTPTSESPTNEAKPPITSAESASVPRPSPAPASATDTGEAILEKTSAQNEIPTVAPIKAVVLPEPPEPAAKPPRAAVVEEKDEAPRDKGKKPRRPD